MPASRRTEVEAPDDSPPVERLSATLVAYTDRPDRRTIYPHGTTSVARMSTWLTADADAFVALESMR
ncbi:DUF7511 domain-containing protein [Haloglomus salinum]|jgi:hypothetical protein|uniref:DUF7511 domain-containing protein n=1 Tax=Haloglomus salinum TaxID=2962673 RepID=UPI0020CA2285|nr:hypothetical protein [Haloglomus salinum]